MIVGHIDNLQQDKATLSPGLSKAFEFIQKNDVLSLAPGKYEIEGDRLFVLVQHYKSKAKQECRLETHEKYIDLQYVAKGREYMAYVPYSSALIVDEDHLKDRDVRFYKGCGLETDVLLSDGMYAVLYPSDVHAPGAFVVAPADVVKLVFKIHVGLV